MVQGRPSAFVPDDVLREAHRRVAGGLGVEASFRFRRAEDRRFGGRRRFVFFAGAGLPSVFGSRRRVLLFDDFPGVGPSDRHHRYKPQSHRHKSDQAPCHSSLLIRIDVKTQSLRMALFLSAPTRLQTSTRRHQA